MQIHARVDIRSCSGGRKFRTAQVIALWAFRPLCAERLAPASKPQLELPRACHAAGGKYLIFRVPFGVFRHSMSLFSVDSSGLAKVEVASSSLVSRSICTSAEFHGILWNSVSS
jgi:hypothetical protein